MDEMVQNKTRRARGRPRNYDPDQALAQAMDAFWFGGYSGTSLDVLSESTGMKRPSLYGAFGDKRSLYLSALDRYAAEGRETMRSALDADVRLRESLKDFYDRAISSFVPRKTAARGCFLVGTAPVESMADPGIRAKLREALRGIDGIFETRFRQAQSQGELDRAADPAALAKMASAVLHTLAIRSRAGDSRAALDAIAETGAQLICGGCPRRPSRRGPTSRRSRAPRR